MEPYAVTPFPPESPVQSQILESTGGFSAEVRFEPEFSPKQIEP